MVLIKYSILITLFLPFYLLGQDNPLEGKKLKDLEIEIIYVEGSEMNVDSKFSIWTIVKVENGKPLESLVYQGYKPSTYDVKIIGAKMNKYNPYNQDPYKYCEEYDNKELIISVTAKGLNTITKTLKFTMNCTPDPAIIAQKKEEEEEEIKRLAIENAKAKAAKEKLDIELAKIEKLASEGNLIGLTIPYSTTSYTTFDNIEFRHIKTVQIDNEYLFLGSAYNEEREKMVPAIYKLTNNQLVPLTIDVDDFPLLKTTAIRDLIKVSANEIVVSADNGLIKMIKTSTGYKETLHVHAKSDYPLSFTRIVDLGNGKCVSVGYPRRVYAGKLNTVKTREVSAYDYAFEDRYKEYRDKGISVTDYRFPDTKVDTSAYMVIWDYNTGGLAYMLMGGNISEESIISADNNGNIICSMGGNSRQFAPEPTVSALYYKAKQNVICSIDAAKSFENDQIWYNWTQNIDTGNSRDRKLTFVVTDIIVEDNNDIVFSAISHHDDLYDINKSKNMKFSSSVGIGRLSPEGNVKNWIFDTGLNNSLWGGSETGNLELKNNPGKVYYNSYEFPKLLKSTEGKGYIMTSQVGYDKLTYPKTSDRYSDSKTVINHSTPILVYLNKKSLEPISFDIISNGKYDSQDDFLFYNSRSKKYSYIGTRHSYSKASFILEFSLNLDTNWPRKPNVKEYKAGDNIYHQYMKELDASYQLAANDYTDNNSTSSNNSSSSSSSSIVTSNNDEVKLVQVYVDPNGRGTVKIYWKQDGSNKKFTLTGSRGAIGYIPEGTELSYSVGPDHNKKNTFYTVPSGKSSVSVKL